ncbi:MAG: sigma-54-dependent Fis family transcriptional regulator [Planctomycetaceae bacterium]|nr:sigma-54-dependent Fis family transcriptional regulator [Planctomycetaceae bacterium]
MNRVLVVDDEPLICWTLRDHLADEGYSVAVAANAEEALAAIESDTPDVILLDVRMPGIDGLTLLERLRSRDLQIPVIIMTAFGTLETAVRAVHGGAAEYLTKPFDLDAATRLVERLVKRPPPDRSPSESGDAVSPILVGQSAAMQAVFKQIALVAEADTAVLITGESGTGKELVAEAIHKHSSRSAGPFLPVHLAALSPQVIESELFGHVRGAFTGADRDREGLLQQARGGTLFLDEIGDVPPAVQIKLLRIIERREYTPVGDPRPRPGDFRILAATHRPLAELAAAGEFRADLLFRLNAFRIDLPPLRERLDDLPCLTQHLLNRIVRKPFAGRIAPDFQRELASRPWIGNVRELYQALEYATIISRDGELRPEHLPLPVLIDSTSQPRSVSPDSIPHDPESIAIALRQSLERWIEDKLSRPASTTDGLYAELLNQLEPTLFRKVLESCQWQRGKAADLLGIHRGTLRDKLRDHHLDQE